MISTHILDTSLGMPAKDVSVVLEKLEGLEWQKLFESKTNTDGRIAFDCAYEAGDYRLTFDIVDYFKSHNQESFFLNTPVAFRITDTKRKYHVPLLLNPYGYSTYRGS
jgi:5-hydroxyisourate hydrolase